MALVRRVQYVKLGSGKLRRGEEHGYEESDVMQELSLVGEEIPC